MSSNTYLIIVNDFRSIPMFAAYCIARRYRQETVKILVSRRFIEHIEYGQYLPKWYKSLKLYILQQFCNVTVVPCVPDLNFDISMLKGVDSSLQSITCDSGATAERYPFIAANLQQQAMGSKEIANYICTLDKRPEVVYLFNGRTASASAIVSSLHKREITINYYEFSMRSGGYHVYPYSCHNSLQLGRDLINLWRWTIISTPDLFIDGREYEAAKLNNDFVKIYKSVPLEFFDIAIFLSSDHEYTNLQLDIVNIEVKGNYGLLEYVLAKYGKNKKIAVRAHPNQKNDPNSEISLQGIINLCHENGFIYYGPGSDVSSYDLIKRSSLTVVEFSSIAFDAIFLGSKVDVVGDRDLKVILGDIPEEDKLNSQYVRYRVREMVTLYNELFFYRFPNKWLRFLSRIITYFDRQLSNFDKPKVSS